MDEPEEGSWLGRLNIRAILAEFEELGWSGNVSIRLRAAKNPSLGYTGDPTLVWSVSLSSIGNGPYRVWGFEGPSIRVLLQEAVQWAKEHQQ